MLIRPPEKDQTFVNRLIWRIRFCILSICSASKWQTTASWIRLAFRPQFNRKKFIAFDRNVVQCLKGCEKSIMLIRSHDKKRISFSSGRIFIPPGKSAKPHITLNLLRAMCDKGNAFCVTLLFFCLLKWKWKTPSTGEMRIDKPIARLSAFQLHKFRSNNNI